ncbi:MULTISPECIES: helicase HerA domain-containing protein [unclassified Coleofasciculus]|uniref:helicase HerA domain-containing protein n=1 Tax=unclassified Coleofasciculus TaxID=2692782 RepID=UPI00187E924A|nr:MULTISPECIES: DUF87 domain-containing protein [unclassified Coleofasciculus]MBE9128211.1 hypothetical protein [Coleofasciculus sp. LEGE 07081]MBE9150947.1 hypothetical protein [Coleofasciculus sp. LEGE 07092]
MNQKLVMLGSLGLGLLGAGVGVTGYFDGTLHYCQPVKNGCIEKSLPDWLNPPSGAINISYSRGNAGIKLLGSLFGIGGFVTAMHLSRTLLSVEPQKEKLRSLWNGHTLARERLRAEADLQSYANQVMLEAAEVAYSIIEPYQPDLPLLEGDTLDDVIDPGDKVVGSSSQVLEGTITTAPSTWIDHFISSTALIWGNQGSGKSWMARYIAKLKKEKGYRVVVLDPDSNRAEWQGVESYHDFDEIADFLKWYVAELTGRYQEFNHSNMAEDAWRAKLWADGRALAVVCEEVTTYVDLIEDKDLLTQFFRLGLTKSRKQEMPLTFVSHNNTQSALGGIKGLANLIEKMLQLELQTDINPDTLQPVASGRGAVKLDGSNQWTPVTLPKLERKITDFRTDADRVSDTRSYLERQFLPPRAEPPQVPREPLNQPTREGSGDAEPRFTALNLTREQAIELINQLRTELNQTQVIETLWRCKKGGSAAWGNAREQFRELIGE